MSFSWTQAAAGALFIGLLGGMLVLPGRLIAPEHRVQLPLSSLQVSAGATSIQAAPIVQHAEPVAPVTRPVRRPAATNHLASVVVKTRKQPVNHVSHPVTRVRTPARPVAHHIAVSERVAPKAPAVA